MWFSYLSWKKYEISQLITLKSQLIKQCGHCYNRITSYKYCRLRLIIFPESIRTHIQPLKLLVIYGHRQGPSSE